LEVPYTSLIKFSSPGWRKRFNNDIDLKLEMYSHVCGMCRKVYTITESSSMDDLLSTDCGCEFGIEDSLDD
jgi:hypothetical protein